MGPRHFENPHEQVPALIDGDGTRRLLNAAGVALKKLKAAAKAHSDVSGGGVYVGLGGVALTYLRMAQRAQRGVAYAHSKYLKKHTWEHALALAESFAADAEALLPARRATFLEGLPGGLALAAAAAALRGDGAACRAKVAELEAFGESSVSALPAGECELLYGRAGYLYSLLWLERQLGPGAISQAAVQGVVSHLLEQGAAGARELEEAGGGRWGLMYKWHDKRYLGAAHGLSGIAYVLLHALPAVRQADPSGGGVAALTAACDALAAALLPSGNLPSSLGSRDDRLVQWCHGAPGLIPTMLKAEAALGGGGRYLAAARAAARAVWERGLLRKGVGLCHGISGNGYAFISLYRATGEPEYLAMAQAFALYATERWEELYEVPDRPASLYEGLAGFVNFALDALDPAASCWPGAEL